MESTLSLKLADLQAKVGTYAGWGRGAAFGEPAYTAQQQAILDDCTQSGLRRFYFPQPAAGESASYDWSFLRPTASLALAQGASSVPLPDDFGGFEGPVTVLASGAASQPWVIQWESEPALRARYAATPSVTGPPRWVAERPLRGTTPTQGQRFELAVFPLADRAYTLQAQYYLSPDYLTGAAPYAYGGVQHAETVLAACLWVFEERYDDQPEGPQSRAFAERLLASISMDRRSKPQRLGYNGDRSDERHRGRDSWHHAAAAATYAGSAFE